MTGLPASAPISPSPSTAVPLVTTATRLPLRRVLVRVVRILLDLQARLRHSRRVGQAQIALAPAWLRRCDLNFPRLRIAVIIQSLLLGNNHDASLPALRNRPKTTRHRRHTPARRRGRAALLAPRQAPTQKRASAPVLFALLFRTAPPHRHVRIPVMHFLVKFPARNRPRAHRRQFARGTLQQFRHKAFHFCPDLRIRQCRHQLRFRYVRKSTAQRTFHQIIVNHLPPPERDLAPCGRIRTALCASLQSPQTIEAVTRIASPRDANHVLTSLQVFVIQSRTL